MLNIIEILFLIFGKLYDKNGFLVTSLVLSSVFLLFSLIYKSKEVEVDSLCILAQVICLSLSIIFLCL